MITKRVDPQISCSYLSSRIKQYFKEHRTTVAHETVICDTRDFGIGRRVAVLFTMVYGRVLAPGLAELDPRLPKDLAHRSDLAHAWRQLDRSLNQFTNKALTAA